MLLFYFELLFIYVIILFKVIILKKKKVIHVFSCKTSLYFFNVTKMESSSTKNICLKTIISTRELSSIKCFELKLLQSVISFVFIFFFIL